MSEIEVRERTVESARILTRPSCMTDVQMHYCPGCGHGIIHRVLAELIDEMGIRERTIIVAPVGCAVLLYDYIDVDCSEAAHGRTPAVATGIKRVHPDAVVFTYQGDGDLAAIGTAEIIHAANRGERITTIFVNNANYGMTGGQMAPTTLIGQKTLTTPTGRKASLEGYPIKVCELLATLENARYLVRTSVHNAKGVIATKRAIEKAIQVQEANVGFGLVEVLSTCPTNWGMEPVDACKWVEENMVPYFPLGVVKDTSGI
ncbi:MAG: thiamine pyrophosphate-dependent enzyme [bacterium]